MKPSPGSESDSERHPGNSTVSLANSDRVREAYVYTNQIVTANFSNSFGVAVFVGIFGPRVSYPGNTDRHPTENTEGVIELQPRVSYPGCAGRRSSGTLKEFLNSLTARRPC